VRINRSQLQIRSSLPTEDTQRKPNVTRFPAKFAPSDKAHFSPPINCYTNELMIHVYSIANDSLVCFSWGCFLRPVWRAWVLRWSLNDSDVNGQVSTWLEIATQLARRLGQQIGYCLWYLELKWASGETFWHVNFNTWKTRYFHGSPPPPTSTPIWSFVIVV